VKRATAKEILAFWLYSIRKEAGLDDYGSVDTDQAGAEHIIKFFEDMNDANSETVRDWQWEHIFEDYQMFQSLCSEIRE
jgi:hypothetical protein